MKRFALLALAAFSLTAFEALAAESPMLPSAASEMPQEGRSILVNLPQKKLFFFENGKLVSSYDTGVGKPGSQTPVGDWKITEKRPNPAWYVPASIKGEYARKGKHVADVVPAGPNNPLGKFFMKVGSSSIGIHGTNAPSSVPGWVSHGCIRLRNEDALELGSKVQVGDPVKIAYDRILVDKQPDKTVVALAPNPYNKEKIDSSKALAGLEKLIPNFALRADKADIAQRLARGEKIEIALQISGQPSAPAAAPADAAASPQQ